MKLHLPHLRDPVERYLHTKYVFKHGLSVGTVTSGVLFLVDPAATMFTWVAVVIGVGTNLIWIWGDFS